MSLQEEAANNPRTNNGEVCDRLINTNTLDDPEEPQGQTDGKIIRGQLLSQCLLIATVILYGINAGTSLGYPAVLIPQVKSANETLNIDDEKGSWIVSVYSIVQPPGIILSGFLSERLGRRCTLRIYAVIAGVGWLFFTVSQSYVMLLIGRAIAGLSAGLGIVGGQIYIAEVSTAKMRAVLNVIALAVYILGVLVIYSLGFVAHWKVIAGLGAVPSIVYVAILFLVPETPVWLAQQQRVKKAITAYTWFHGNDLAQAQHEIQQMISRATEEKINQSVQQPSAWSTLKSPSVLKPFLIVTTINILYTFSGVYLLIVYPAEIISATKFSNVNLLSILTAGVRFVFIILACFLLAFFGRRTVCIFSGLASTASGLALATVLYLDNDTDGYYAATCLLFYIAASTIGIFLLPTIMIGELFPAKARGLLSSLSYTILNLSIFGSAKAFPALKGLLSVTGLFWLFSISCFFSSIMVYLILPETKDKTLNEIEDYFSQDNVLWITRNRKTSNNNTRLE